MNHAFQIIINNCYQIHHAAEFQLKAISVDIPDYREVHNHICNMVVTYNDQSEKSLIARVIYNSLNDAWTVDGKALTVNVVDVLTNVHDFEHMHHQSIPELNERNRIAHRAHILHQQAS